MGTVEDKLNKLLETKESIKNAIVEKGQTVSDSDTFASYADKIAAIETGIDTSDATATAADMLSGKTAYVNGELITGQIETKTAADIEVDKSMVTTPAGYYETDVFTTISEAEQATPTISVDSDGLITASATQTVGYVLAGTKSATKQLTTQAAKTVTPSTSTQTAVAAGRYTIGAVKVAGDSNLLSENIVSGKSIFGVSGSYSGGEVKQLEITSSMISMDSITREFYDSDGSLINTQTFTVPIITLPFEAEKMISAIIFGNPGTNNSYWSDYCLMTIFPGKHGSNTSTHNYYTAHVSQCLATPMGVHHEKEVIPGGKEITFVVFPALGYYYKFNYGTSNQLIITSSTDAVITFPNATYKSYCWYLD